MTPAIVLPMQEDEGNAREGVAIPRPLTGKQNAFIDAYLTADVAFNATEAARIAGYADSSPHALEQAGHRALRNSEVSREIQRRINAAKLTREYVIDGLMRNADGAFRDKAYGASTAALRELGRILALFVDRTELDIRAAIAQVSAEQGLDPDELEAEVKRLAADSS